MECIDKNILPQKYWMYVHSYICWVEILRAIACWSRASWGNTYYIRLDLSAQVICYEVDIYWEDYKHAHSYKL